jgi:hypothetical protein
MPISGYEIAFACATTEVEEIGEQIEQLKARKVLIEKLLGCLRALDPHLEPAEQSIPSTEAAQTEAPAHETPVHEGQYRDGHAHEGQAHEELAHHEG